MGSASAAPLNMGLYDQRAGDYLRQVMVLVNHCAGKFDDQGELSDEATARVIDGLPGAMYMFQTRAG